MVIAQRICMTLFQNTLVRSIDWRDLVYERESHLLNEEARVLPIQYRITASHLGRNYNFGLNDEYDVDAAELGNEARIINHDMARVNCVVKGEAVLCKIS
jgi:hypothetical protein